MFRIGNSLTQLIVDEEEHCQCHGRRRGLGPATLLSALCQKHSEESNLNSEDLEASTPADGQAVAQSLEELDKNTASTDGNYSRSGRRRRPLLIVSGHLLLGFTLFALTFLTLGCIVLGLNLNSTQAKLWLSLSLLGMLLQLCVFETIKILVLALYWTLLSNDLMR